MSSFGETFPTNHPGKPTFSAVVYGTVAAVNPTDIYTIFAAGAKTIKILSIDLFFAAYNYNAFGGGSPYVGHPVTLIKRTSANSGGASSTLTPVAMDSQNDGGGATGVVKAYTSNPSLGTSAGVIEQSLYSGSPAATPNTAAQLFPLYRAPKIGGQAITLRPGEGLAVNLGGVSALGTNPTFGYKVTWTEE